MSEASTHEQRSGAVHWIDHFVTATNDIDRWVAFHQRVVGGIPWGDFPAAMRSMGMFLNVARGRIGAFVSKKPLPQTLGLGAGLPRYGFYTYAADLDAHARRLDAVGAVHGAPMRMASEGEAGISLPWQDPDGNQFEFWAPDVLPEGAMADCGPERVGRISHAVFESRDLDRTAALFAQYCGLYPEPRAEIGSDTLVLCLGSGGRIVFRKVDELGGRTTGCGLPDAHTALLVHTDDFFPTYARLWAGLPEWEFDPLEDRAMQDALLLPPRTVLHPSPGGRRFRALTHRGDDFFDWDTNLFHFYGGVPVRDSMAIYEGRSIEYYATEWERTHGGVETLLP